MDQNEFQEIVNDFVEMPIHRVKKKRVMSQKQQENWARALETRRKNIEMRKKAKEEISKIEKEQLMNDPGIKQREKRLKELLLLMLSSEERNEKSGAKRPIESKPNQLKQINQEPPTENVVIKRINNNNNEEKEIDEEKEDDSDFSRACLGPRTKEDNVSHYIPKTSLSTNRRNINPSLKPRMKPRPTTAASDDDENEVSIFRD